jgi:anthranilate phosphoribosyltransferase
MVHLGTERTLVVSGEDGLGDVTLAGTTQVTEVVGGKSRDFSWTPEEFGIDRQSLEGLSVDSPAESAAIVRQVLEGVQGPARDLVLLNAAAGLLAFGKTADARAAAAEAAAAIDSGAAASLLVRLVKRSHEPA